MSEVSANDMRVDIGSIEKSLSQLWRSENKETEDAITRAALWNVVAHTPNATLQMHANETLSKVAIAVPQRTIVIRSEPAAAPDMSTWIAANCHMISGNKQVCSEAVSIVAGGDRIHHVGPLVSALLLPDMPVAVWWVGDLPNEHEEYVETLLDPADRLIVDSAYFDRAADFALMSRIATRTSTAPCDLNWVRLEEWRVATAALFDPPSVRDRLRKIRKVRVAAAAGENSFGDSAEAVLYAAWLSAQLGHTVSDKGKVTGPAGSIDYEVRTEKRSQRAGSLIDVAIDFDDGSIAAIRRDEERQVIVTVVDGRTQSFDCVTRMMSRGLDDVIVRQLKRADADRVFVKSLPAASKLAERIAA